AEDGIRDRNVTGVQTCALPIWTILSHTTGLAVDDPPSRLWLTDGGVYDNLGMQTVQSFHTVLASDGGAPLNYANRVGHNWGSQRSEERRVGKGGSCRRGACNVK